MDNTTPERLRKWEPAIQPLDWRPGPAEGGGGTAGGGPEDSIWFDGDRLLVVVNCEDGVFIDLVFISVVDDHAVFHVGEADYFSYSESAISWWAEIGPENVPNCC